MTKTALQPFCYVPESDDAFLGLFPYRFDYIYAEHPPWGERPHWQTERRYPLSDRLLLQPTRLYGVRFGSQTRYCLLDLDRGSPYHPHTDPLATGRLLAALEGIGLVTPVACTSSYSGGIHLYFPLAAAQPSWELAQAVATTLEKAGFLLRPGQLELFPNPKPYRVGEPPSLFNAHRLPMQAGSYLLNADWQPLWSDRSRFVRQWQLAQSRNALDWDILHRLVQQALSKPRQLSRKASQFLADLNADIEPGWTGFGQTNYLLGRIAMRSYIFHPALTGEPPLTGKALVAAIVETARSLPGYTQWCRHQHEIVNRAEAWASCIENSHYFPYGSSKSQPSPDNTSAESRESWNQKQSAASRHRIQAAMADLVAQNALPEGATARFQKLVQYGIGGGTLYKHRDLWHPNHLGNAEPSDLPRSNQSTALTPVTQPTSLLPATARNGLKDGALTDFAAEVSFQSGRNEAGVLLNPLEQVVEDAVTTSPKQSTRNDSQISFGAALSGRVRALLGKITAGGAVQGSRSQASRWRCWFVRFGRQEPP
ncbi:MAG: hypothetical protein IGS38_13095 [Synechococcales cyanobacterium M58_A2018_015]|nr:hypothetical protein [Synechococcales cyanobacterium M58_A2018_015]